MVIAVNGKHVVSPNVEGELKSKQYRFADIPAVKEAVITKFPCYGLLSMMIAPMRVYPAIKAHGKVKV